MSEPTVIAVGHPLLDVSAGWDLLVRGQDADLRGEVVRIELASGRVTYTTLPTLLSDGVVAFIADADRAIVRPIVEVPGYQVPDGQPARELSGLLSRGGLVIPGPKPGQLWVDSSTAGHPKMSLINMDGVSAGVPMPVSMPIPAFVSAESGTSPQPDGGGYVLIGGPSGTYDVRPDGVRKITSGKVVAAGPTGWLAVECDAAQRCVNVVIDRVDFARRVLPGAAVATSQLGVISSDGSTAAIAEDAGVLSLIDLNTGAARPLDIEVGSAGTEWGGVVWSPDGRWLFAVGADSRLRVVDVHARQISELPIPLPYVAQVAVGLASR